jgi:hypothetical protein
MKLIMDYRIYDLREDGGIFGVREEPHDTDQKAVAAVWPRLAFGQRVEIWRGAVFVATLRGPEVVTTLA